MLKKTIIEKIKEGLLDYITEKKIEYKGIQSYPGIGVPLSDPIVDTPPGIYAFIKLSDCPVTYVGQAGKYPKVNVAENGLEFATVAAGGSVGGKYGINVESLTGNKSLTPDTDEIYQYLNPNGANRTITLATSGASAGDRFIIRHNGNYNDTYALYIKQSTTWLDAIYAGGIGEFIFDGTNWISRGIGTGENDNKKKNIAIGYWTKGYDKGVAVGYSADGCGKGVGVGYYARGQTYGVAVGYDSYAPTYGVAIGYNSKGYSHGVGIGYLAQGYDEGIAIGAQSKGLDYSIALGMNADTNSKKYSLALGYKTKCHRTSEICQNICGSSTQNKIITSAGWLGFTSDAILKEIFLSNIANERFTIQTVSVLYFEIMVVARQSTNNEAAAYKIEGVIKRDSSNNTTLLYSNKTVIYEDDASWDVTVSADDVNEALVIKVNGDATHGVIWGAKLEGIEVMV